MNMDSILRLLIGILCLTGSHFLTAQQTDFWKNGDFQFETDYIKDFIPLELNSSLLLEQLSDAPMEFTEEARNNPKIIGFPMPDGSILNFKTFESPVLHPDLGARYPHFKTWCGQGIEDRTAIIRFDWTEKGLHAYIHSVEGTVIIDPVDIESEYYISYHKKDLINLNTSGHFCNHEQKTSDYSPIQQEQEIGVEQRSVGESIRTFRLAVATTGEYSFYHGNNEASVLSAVMTSVNRINQIFENELSARFVLIPTTTDMFYYDEDTDPFTDGDSGEVLFENITTMPGIIGLNNFDVGHVFGTGGGGIANLGSVCSDNKAAGVTGVSPPTGDFFSVQYCCHELGHQFTANHTWSNCTDALNGDQFSFDTAVEPGSGSTIMSYAGLCAGNLDIISSSDDYFNGKSLEEMINFINFNSNCPETTPSGNNPPEVDAGIGQNVYIPISTPFELTAIATDEDDDVLTYCWEQFNTGPISPLGDPIGNTPTFRSFKPKTSPTRIFPSLVYLILGSSTNKEVLPTYNRNLTFNVTVRDNHAGAGGIAQDQVSFNATSIAGPFVVNTPSLGSVYNGGDEAEVTWDVANTDSAPVSSPFVDIYLSTNNGQSFEMLSENVANSGSYNVTLPMINAVNARLKVKGHDNIFFNLSPKFKIETVINTQEIDNNLAVDVYPNPASDVINIKINEVDLDAVKIEIYSIHGQLIHTKRLTTVDRLYQIDSSDFTNGTYLMKLSTDHKVFTKKIAIKK